MYFVFSFPYFSGDMFRSCRPSSGALTETELKVHAEQLRSMSSHNAYSYIKIYVKY